MKTPDQISSSALCSLPDPAFNSKLDGTRTSTALPARKRARIVFHVTVSVFVLCVFLLPVFRTGVNRGGVTQAQSETVQTFASSDCTTPKSEWDLGQTVCAVVVGAPTEQRIVWIAPDGSVAKVSASFIGSGSDSYTLLTGSDPLAQYGTWKVEAMDNAGAGFAIVSFLVRPEGTPSADLSILKFGPLQAVGGSNITYIVQVSNAGPDAAQSVVISEATPNDCTFFSEVQNAGPQASCQDPQSGGTGASTCTIPTLEPNQTATFSFTYSVNSNTPLDTLILNTATVSSSTAELFAGNNSATYQTGVVGAAAAPACTVNCPPDISTTSDTDQCSAVVTYSTPGTSGSCTDPETGQAQAVVCNPPSGFAFPVGISTVICSSAGSSCTFNVTVTDTRPPADPTISCPANITTNETEPGAGSAVVSYPSPTTTGNCVTVVCDPPSGTAFPVGSTTVSCSGSDSANHSVSCSFTVTVISGDCAITCPNDITVTASAGQCGAVVSYAAPTTTGTCGTVTCSPASGTSFQTGTTLVTCVSTTSGANCSFSVTVVPASAPTITTCATDKQVPVDSNCEGVIPNLLGEVTTTGCSVTVSQSPAPGSVVTAGIYTVTITAENLAGSATCTATVKVDTTPPVIGSCPANFSVNLPTNSTATSTTVSYSPPTATDNCGAATVACTPASGSSFPVGTTTVVCTATDAVNNTSSCSFTITVLYNFSGFFPPVSNPPALNNVNAGRAIPVKFSLSGNKGLAVFASGYPVSGQIQCDASAPPNDVTETVTAGGSSLSYDPSSDQYIYVWKTESSWGGTCRQLIVKLNDGTQHVANFKFR